jgi:hypothetical protein
VHTISPPLHLSTELEPREPLQVILTATASLFHSPNSHQVPIHVHARCQTTVQGYTGLCQKATGHTGPDRCVPSCTAAIPNLTSTSIPLRTTTTRARFSRMKMQDISSSFTWVKNYPTTLQTQRAQTLRGKPSNKSSTRQEGFARPSLQLRYAGYVRTILKASLTTLSGHRLTWWKHRISNL